jgi:hypothetical protein
VLYLWIEGVQLKAEHITSMESSEPARQDMIVHLNMCKLESDDLHVQKKEKAPQSYKDASK